MEQKNLSKKCEEGCINRRGGEDDVAKGDDIQARLVRFAVKCLDLCDAIPKSSSGSHIAAQLLRSASSAAPNYAEARGAESKNDFIHKLGIVYKELNETEVWLEILKQRDSIPDQRLAPIQEECKILCRIIAASRKTASGTRRFEEEKEKPD
jgi:four helix bundle protein